MTIRVLVNLAIERTPLYLKCYANPNFRTFHAKISQVLVINFQKKKTNFNQWNCYKSFQVYDTNNWIRKSLFQIHWFSEQFSYMSEISNWLSGLTDEQLWRKGPTLRNRRVGNVRQNVNQEKWKKKEMDCLYSRNVPGWPSCDNVWARSTSEFSKNSSLFFHCSALISLPVFSSIHEASIVPVCCSRQWQKWEAEKFSQAKTAGLPINFIVLLITESIVQFLSFWTCEKPSPCN